MALFRLPWKLSKGYFLSFDSLYSSKEIRLLLTISKQGAGLEKSAGL